MTMKQLNNKFWRDTKKESKLKKNYNQQIEKKMPKTSGLVLLAQKTIS